MAEIHNFSAVADSKFQYQPFPLHKLSLLHIVPSLDPKHGGPSYCVPQLCRALRAWGVGATVLTLREGRTSQADYVSSYPQDFAGVPLLGRLRFSAGLARAADQDARAADVVHAHGLWLMPNVHAGRTAARAGKPLVVSPRGMLSPGALAFSRRKKALFWRLVQGPAYARAACWYASSELEAEELRAFGIRAPIAVIPNGVDLPARPPERGPKAGKTVLFLGRLHPKKGLDRLIEAWPAVAAEYPDWRLRIVGPDEGGHRADLEAAVASSRAPRVSFDGALYGEARDAALAEADLFVLPTRSENFGIAVAEALAAEVPAIVTRAAPWSGLESERCGWWIDEGVAPLAEALRAAMAVPDAERRAMGARGRAWVARDFAWTGIAEKSLELYRWVTGLGARPAFVRTD